MPPTPVYQVSALPCKKPAPVKKEPSAGSAHFPFAETRPGRYTGEAHRKIQTSYLGTTGRITREGRDLS